MLSSSQPESSLPPSDGVHGAASVPSGSQTRDALLQGILQQILDVSDAEPDSTPGNDQFRDALQKVALELREHEFCLDPVLLAMVGAVTGKLSRMTASQKLAMEKSVATSMFEDLSARERLERLWRHLVRLASHAE